VWTNSFCGHPAPDEQIADAVHRRARQELGLTLDSLDCPLPDYRYRAVAADGTVENEVCPVYCARAVGPVRPAPEEVMDHTWVSWHELRGAAGLPWAISPWAVEQIPLLEAHVDRRFV
jgi:isopentenyl-diphosphate delta-isomerase